MSAWKLTDIYIHGFRRIQEPLTVKLTDSIDRPIDRLIVAGSNGSGKTSLLEAILFGLGQEQLIGRGLSSEQVVAGRRHVFPPGAWIHLVFRGPDGATVSFERSDAELYWVRRPEDEHAGQLVQPGAAPVLDGITIEARYFSSWRSPLLVGARPASLTPVKTTEADRLAWFKQSVINQRALRAFRPNKTADAEWLARLNRAWALFHGDDGTHIDADVVDDTDAKSVLFDLFIFEPDGTRRCSIDDASAGELELLGFAAEFVVDDYAGLVLIDEPELHLHPEWTSQIMRALRALAPRAQFIVSTHADAPWDQASSYERLMLGPPDDPRVAVQSRSEG